MCIIDRSTFAVIYVFVYLSPHILVFRSINMLEEQILR